MATNNNAPDEDAREEDETAFDFWTDYGARRFNEALDEGSAYMSANRCGASEPQIDAEDEQDECGDAEFCDSNDNSLPPGEMELIFENCYVM